MATLKLGSTTAISESSGAITYDAGTIGSNIVFPAGHVIQVLYKSQSGSDADTAVSNTTKTAIAGLSQAITVLASSKVFVHFNIHVYIQEHTANNWSVANLNIFRGSTDIYMPANTSNPYTHGRYTTDANDREMKVVSISYLDTPGSAGAHTYSAKINSKNGFVVGSYPSMGYSNMTLMEVAG